MFILQLLTSHKDLIINKWLSNNVSIDSTFGISSTNGWTYITCLKGFNSFNNRELNLVNIPIEEFLRLTDTPVMWRRDTGFSCLYYTPEYVHKHQFFSNTQVDQLSISFNLSEQLERYRVALLLKTTE